MAPRLRFRCGVGGAGGRAARGAGSSIGAGGSSSVFALPVEHRVVLAGSREVCGLGRVRLGVDRVVGARPGSLWVGAS